MAVLDARKRMAEVQKAPPSERVVVYKQIMQRMHPVMRHFFTERHHQPYYWFRLRLNYSRSTAVMSMIGHVMGIGDRHVSNIMIDTVTGELVPIDFGIAFEGVSRSLVAVAVERMLTNGSHVGKATANTRVGTFSADAGHHRRLWFHWS